MGRRGRFPLATPLVADRHAHGSLCHLVRTVPFGVDSASLVAQMVRNLTARQETPGLILGSGRSHGERNGDPLQYSRLENCMDRGAWSFIVHGIAKSWTPLKQLTHTHAHGQGRSYDELSRGVSVKSLLRVDIQAPRPAGHASRACLVDENNTAVAQRWGGSLDV